jgi:hypothetical protein
MMIKWMMDVMGGCGGGACLAVSQERKGDT